MPSESDEGDLLRDVELAGAGQGSSMKRADWDRVKQLFQTTPDRAPDERTAYLHEQCGDDRTLQAETESLLAAHEKAGGFAARPELELLGALDSDNRMTAGGRLVTPAAI
jgi:hypothetical protein